MEREIVEQPAAIARALAYGGRLGEDRVFLGGLDRRREDMDNIKHLLLVGCGTIPASRAVPSTRLRE
jgi:glucosamine--fructose-6-phosphate aminotransferase (isomerizing)